MTDRKPGTDAPEPSDTAPTDPVAELDEILAEIQANPRIQFSDEELDAMEREQIGYDESVHPYLY
jgi:hypothetical protein